MDWLSGLNLATNVFSTVMGAWGQYEEGQQSQEAEEYNAKLAELEAEQYRRKGALEKYQKEREVGQLISEQKAKYGASGVERSGSPLKVIVDSMKEGILDTMVIDYNTKVAMQNRQAEADYRRTVGKQYARAGMWGAGKTLLSMGLQTKSTKQQSPWDWPSISSGTIAAGKVGSSSLDVGSSAPARTILGGTF